MKKYASLLLVVIFVFVAGASFAKDATTVTGVANVNTATKDQLVLIPWIGEARAEQIIAARTQKPFVQLEDLLAINGVGEKVLAKIAPYVAFKGETTIQEVKAATDAPAKKVVTN